RRAPSAQGRGGPLMMTADLRARVLRLAAAEPSPTRNQVQRAGRMALAAAATVAAAIVAAAGGVRPTGRPLELRATTAALAASVAASSWFVAVRRGAEPSRRALVTLLVAAPLALVAGKLLLSSGWPGMMDPWPDRSGLRCLALTLAVAAAP